MKNYKVYICLICKNKKNDQNEFYPFCSKKCRDIDLSKWLNEEYAIEDNIIEQE
ncbi:MAG: DNA gyrase inhibitor YacG [SAR116 cluster bacterium]|jgi:endogenous inhibitor of DNA gyrase (YacG/DUF329 family)|nr:DNA gyrase inhibitor YacG [SAR116 cluster bacterium]|tara:strand:+ start:361 stop:522 length:162 start_codon:yes stop_codon:yes gene_type:complete